MMCGIDEAIRHLREDCTGFLWVEQVINRLDYHRRQATWEKPRYHKGMVCKDYYTCRNCGRTVQIDNNYCAGCGFALNWDSVRCLTGLPLVDAAERAKDEDQQGTLPV